MSDETEAALDVAEPECEEPAAIAELSAIDVEESLDMKAVEELLGMADGALEAFADGGTIGTLTLESFLAPGGGWGGSELPVRRAIRIGRPNGLEVTSLKRASGSSRSDHHASQRMAFAVDMSNGVGPTPQMLRTARQIAAAMGYSWPSSGYLQTRTTSRGYRAQLIYNAPRYPGHHNHVHFGVRKVR